MNEEGDPTSSGETQAKASLQQIHEWELGEVIRALVFDTTASNTGLWKGAAVRIMKDLGRLVFFLACRHHICELIAKACWYAVFEEDLGPECKLFAGIMRLE